MKYNKFFNDAPSLQGTRRGKRNTDNRTSKFSRSTFVKKIVVKMWCASSIANFNLR